MKGGENESSGTHNPHESATSQVRGKIAVKDDSVGTTDAKMAYKEGRMSQGAG
jgi:hypothetical protein